MHYGNNYFIINFQQILILVVFRDVVKFLKYSPLFFNYYEWPFKFYYLAIWSLCICYVPNPLPIKVTRPQCEVCRFFSFLFSMIPGTVYKKINNNNNMVRKPEKRARACQYTQRFRIIYIFIIVIFVLFYVGYEEDVPFGSDH